MYYPSTMPSLASALREHVDGVYASIRKVPGMWGTPSEIEAIWWTILLVEGVLIKPSLPPRVATDARLKAHERVANANAWPSPLPLHANAKGREQITVLLDEVRTHFLEILAETR